MFRMPVTVISAANLYGGFAVRDMDRRCVYQGDERTCRWVAVRLNGGDDLLAVADAFKRVVESLGWDALGGKDCDLKTDVYDPLMVATDRLR